MFLLYNSRNRTNSLSRALLIALFTLSADVVVAESQIITANGSPSSAGTIKLCRDDGTIMYSNVELNRDGWSRCGAVVAEEKCGATGERFFGASGKAPHGYLSCKKGERIKLIHHDRGVERDLFKEYKARDESMPEEEESEVKNSSHIEKAVLRERKRWRALREDIKADERSRRSENAQGGSEFFNLEEMSDGRPQQILQGIVDSLKTASSKHALTENPEELMEQMFGAGGLRGEGDDTELKMDEIMKSFDHINHAMGE